MHGATSIVLLVLVLSPPTTYSMTARAWSGAATTDPVSVLLRSPQVDDESVGYAAKRTDLYAAFAQLYCEGQHAVAGARRLLREGTPAGRVYGYILLHHSAPDQARSDGRALREDDGEVLVQSGCVTASRTVRELVHAIDNDDSVITLPSRPCIDTNLGLWSSEARRP